MLSSHSENLLASAFGNFLVVAVHPSNTAANSIIAATITVKIKDAFGNLKNLNTAITATLTKISGANASLAGTVTKNAVAGVATFTDLKVSGAGVYHLTFSAPKMHNVASLAFTVS